MAFVIDDLASVKRHWSADAITGLSDTDPVDAIPDSIVGDDFTQTSTARPVYEAAGMNSLPSVNFNGSSHWMAADTAETIETNQFGFAMVVRIDVAKSYNSFFMRHATRSASSSYTSAPAYIGAYAPTSESRLRCFFNSQAILTSVNLSPLVADGDIVMFSGVVGPRQLTLRINGQITLRGLEPSSLGAVATGGYSIIGASSLGYFDGSFAELVVWDETVLTESAWVEGVLAHKYGVTIADTTHPFYANPPTVPPGYSQKYHPLGF